MGYGILTPILLLLGYMIKQIIPIILFVQLLSGFSKIVYYFIYTGKTEKMRKDISLKLTGWYLISGFIGIIIGIIFLLFVKQNLVILYIAIMLIIIGIISALDVHITFSKERLAILSGVSSFNQTISGAGYGPIMTYKEVFHKGEYSKVKAITTFSESMMSGIGFLMFYVLFGDIIFADLELFTTILVAGFMATPLGSLITQYVDVKKGTKVIGMVTAILGGFLLILIFFNYF
jgi:uncharacterized membrane protein YfcA